MLLVNKIIFQIKKENGILKKQLTNKTKSYQNELKLLIKYWFEMNLNFHEIQCPMYLINQWDAT